MTRTSRRSPPYAHLRRLQHVHNAWQETLLTKSRPALDAALSELFSMCPELTSVAWTVTRSARANFAYVVTGVEFRLRDGAVWRGDDGALIGESAHANPRRYRPLSLLLLANAEVLAAAVMACPARVTATRDGTLAVTSLPT